MPLRNAIAKVKSLFSAPERGRPRPARRTKMTNFFDSFGESGPHRGGFAGGRIDRTNEEWNPGTIGPNRIFQMSGQRLRERARDLALNNPLAKSAIGAIVDNILDCGFTPKPQFEDRDTRKLWMRAWNRWSGLSALATRECDITGDDTVSELAALWLEEIIVGGGCLTHYVELPRRGRSLPLAIELIPEERFAEHLEYYGKNPKTRNRIINGIEVDQATGRSVAFHIINSMPNDLDFDPEKTLRLPADQCEYYFWKHRVGQKRGHTLMHAVIVWLWALGYYADNELYASQVKSSWAYMIKTSPEYTDFDWTTLLDSDPSTGATDIYGNTIEKHEPGQIWRGAPGDEITGVGPNVPGSDSLPWIMLMQRLIAVGMGLSYEEAVRDYSQGSFSSTRAAANSDRKKFRKLQKKCAWHFYNPTWARFGSHGVRAGLDGFPRPSEFQSAIDEWLDVAWGMPGWQSVNPKEDAMADDIRLKNKTITRKQIVERDGGDIDEHFDDLAREEQMAEERGIVLEPAGVTTEDLQSEQGANDNAR